MHCKLICFWEINAVLNRGFILAPTFLQEPSISIKSSSHLFREFSESPLVTEEADASCFLIFCINGSCCTNFLCDYIIYESTPSLAFSQGALSVVLSWSNSIFFPFAINWFKFLQTEIYLYRFCLFHTVFLDLNFVAVPISLGLLPLQSLSSKLSVMAAKSICLSWVIANSLQSELGRWFLCTLTSSNANSSYTF